MREFIYGFLFSLVLFIVVGIIFYIFGKSLWYPYYEKLIIKKDVTPIKSHKCPEPKVIERNITIIRDKDENLTSKERLKIALAKSDFIIYPNKLTLIALKYEKRLEVWGEDSSGRYRKISTYPFTAFSGRLGPKLKEGDRQIPEGIYGISYLNPNSKFHLSMRVTYPNSFDRKMAKREQRESLGGDIMIHGSNQTIGCIPIGDSKIEELYFLAQKVGIDNIKVIISPVDFRKMEVKIKNHRHPWLKELYSNIKKEIKRY